MIRWAKISYINLNF